MSILLVVVYFVWPQDLPDTGAVKELDIYYEIADDDYGRYQGLSGRASMGDDEAMLFIFDELQKPGFWMRNMDFPLDFIWLDENWRIVEIDSNVLPSTYPSVYKPPVDIKYVLELSAGYAKRMGLTEGDTIKLP